MTSKLVSGTVVAESFSSLEAPMTITLSPNQEEGILAAIRAGQVGSVEEVIDRAIAGLAARAETQATPVAGSPHGTLHEFFMNSPLRGANLNLERAEDPRTVDLG